MYKVILSCLLALSVSVCAAFADPGTPKQRVEDGSARIFNLLLQEEFQNPQTRPNVLKENEKLRSELTRSAGEKKDLQKRLQINYLQIQENNHHKKDLIFGKFQ